MKKNSTLNNRANTGVISTKRNDEELRQIRERAEQRIQLWRRYDDVRKVNAPLVTTVKG